MKAKILATVAVLAAASGVSQELYFGQSKNAMPPGFGVTDFEDGSYYQGNYLYGIENGTGTYCDANGIKTSGLFKNGEFINDIEVTPNTRLMDLRYHIDSNTILESLQVDIQFSEKPNKKKNIVIAPFGTFTVNGQVISAGFINNTRGYRDPKHEKKGSYPTELEYAVFLKTYGERRSQMMLPSIYGYCESGSNDGTNQGEFVSVLRDFEWKKNQLYTLRIHRSGIQKYKGDLYSLICLDLLIHEKDTVISREIGKLAIPGTELHLGPELASIVSTHTKRYFLSDIPSLEYTIKELFINQKPVNFYDAYCRFSYNMPQYSNAKLFDAYSSVAVSIGEAYKLISGTIHDDYYQSYFVYNEVFEENA